MAETTETIKTGSIVLYIGGSDELDTFIIYYCLGEVGTPAYDPKRWMVTFAEQFFNCNEGELIWLMDLPEDQRDKPFRDTLHAFHARHLGGGAKPAPNQTVGA